MARRLVNWLGKLLEGTFGKVDGNLLLLQNRQYLTVSVMRQVARQLVRGIPLSDG